MYKISISSCRGRVEILLVGQLAPRSRPLLKSEESKELAESASLPAPIGRFLESPKWLANAGVGHILLIV